MSDIEIVKVNNKKEQKAFMNFPIKLYKGNPYYVPLLFMDEKKIFEKDYVYNETCDVIFYNAYRDGKMVGRISGIIQRASNEKWGQKRVRFTRFDSIDDQKVSDALFDAVIKWAKEKGMNEIVGPLGYSDLEREGLLIEGFDQMSTYEEQYNYEYYQKLIENYGFDKEVDWLEFKIYRPLPEAARMRKVSNYMLQKYNLHLSFATSIKEFIDKYVLEFFELIDKSYAKIYGTVPFTNKMVEMMIANFKMLARTEDIPIILDSEGRIVAFSIMFPSIAKAVNKSKGHMTIPFIFNFLRTKKKPKVLDMGLIGVLPEYESKGVATAITGALADYMLEHNLEHVETNLILENNPHSLNLLKHFEKEMVKKRRCFVKKI